MERIPPSLVEAARVDGAGQCRAFWSIVVPVSRNAIITAGLFSFLFAWSDFLFALTLTTSRSVRPVTLGIYNYLGGERAELGTGDGHGDSSPPSRRSSCSSSRSGTSPPAR